MTTPPDHQVPRPVFHERRTYRLRRLMEAARLVPVIGVFLCLVPVLWPQSDDARVNSSSALIYIFLAWVGIIFLNSVLAWALGRNLVDDPDVDP